MKTEVKILLYPEEHKSKNGAFFEKLVRDVLETQRYDIVSNVNYTGMEIDCIAKHKDRNEMAYVECKAKDRVDSTEVRNFSFNVRHKKANVGYFIHTVELEHQAAGLKDEIELDKETYNNHYFFGPSKIIELLVDASKIKELDLKEIQKKETINKLILAYTYFGIYYIVIPASGTTEKKYYLFNAVDGKEIKDSTVVADGAYSSTLTIDQALKVGLNDINKLNHEIFSVSLTSISDSAVGKIPVQSTLTNVSSLNDFPKPSPLFTGREKELKDFKEAFENDRLIAIDGLGGIGKTDFVAKCIEKLINAKDKIIWLNGTSESKFDVFVESAGYGYVLKGENKSPLAVYSGFKDLIERDERIIFWDNFQAINDLSFAGFLSFAYPYIKKATIILITKKEPIIENATISTIPLEGLKDDAIEYAKKLKEQFPHKYSSINDEDIHTICESTDGHPLAIQLAMQLMHYGLSADKIIQGIVQYQGRKDVEALTKRLFTDMYNHSSTTDKEKELLQRFSVFKEKVRKEAIDYLMNEQDYFVPLTNLIDNFLIIHKEAFYESHPLIREFSHELLKDKEQVHANVAEYYISQRTEKLSPALEELIYYHLAKSNQIERIEQEIENNGRQFILLGQFSIVKELLDNLKKAQIERPIFNILYGDIAEKTGNWEEAKQYYEQARNQNVDNKVKAEGLIKYGELLFRKGEVNESLKFFIESLEFSKQHFLIKEEGRSLNDIGMVYNILGEKELGEKYLTEALTIGEKIDDKQGIADSLANLGYVYSSTNIAKGLEFFELSISLYKEIQDQAGIQGAYGNYAGLYRDKNDLYNATKSIEKAISISLKIGNKEGTSSSFNTKGTILMRKGKHDEALILFEQSLKISKEIDDRKGVASSLCNIADVYHQKEEFDKALELYNEGLNIFNETGFKNFLAINKGNMANVLYNQDKQEQAVKMQFEALELKESLGEKYGAVTTMCNLAAMLCDDKIKKYSEATYYLFKALAVNKQINSKDKVPLTYVNNLRDRLVGVQEFKQIATDAYNRIEPELKSFLSLKELCKEPITVEHKTQRNDPCYCGSGKKYKNCHGKAS